ncbi:DUF2254 domain-containing protein [Urbifossiella limnaea]|uniref:DUF2254 domain-containing protein n=1 Tax=Urbifossiella limnaea TaxID=2528023 RepID=UPI00192E6D91|nr:DUF2254 domain-containing protein [Urbifossiella limnaea]
MTWEQRYRLRLTVRTSLVPWAVTALAAALVANPAVRALDAATGWRVFGFTTDGARAVLGALAGSMLTFLVFVLSSVLIVVQLAAGQLTPRVIALVFAMRLVKVTLAAFTFTLVYTLAALSRVETAVPDLHVGVAVVLNLLCIVLFFVFVQELSGALRPSTMMQLVADRGRAVIDEVYPTAYDPARPEGPTRATLPAGPVRVVEYAGRSGSVLAFDAAGLSRAARDADSVVELVPQVGDFVAPGDPLVRVVGGKPADEAAVRGCVAVGPERTLEQDPRFAFRILVDVAARALSPAVNDPTTAVMALDQIASLLLLVGRRRLDEGLVRDAAGAVRVVYGTPDWPDFVTLAVSEVRHYGGGSIQVDRRLRALLDHLIGELPAARHAPLREELVLLGRAVERGFQDDTDRRRAAVGDQQGVGGSEG